MPIPRILEPPPEDPYLESVEYQRMDHGEVNRKFVQELLKGPTGPRVIDLGCGPAGIPIELCMQSNRVEILAIDEEPEMLDLAKRDIDAAGFLERIMLAQGDASDIDWLDEDTADTVISNSLIHHMEHPEQGLETAARLVKPQGRIFIRDLARPDSNSEIEDLVKQYCGHESEQAQQLFRQSFHASLTIDEVRNMCGVLGIQPHHVQMSSDRHWTIDWVNPVGSP
ncbi:MAG: class I SAM-dependent methyltransferase [Rubripirellula sp.]